MPSPLEMVVVGAGHRARDAFGPYAEAFPDEVRFVAVAEPNPVRREQFAQRFNIDASMCFASWEELFARPQLAPALLNLTQDQMHVESTVPALERGYHVLLEKPMAQTPDDCVRLVQTAERSGRILQICHVLRFTPFFSALHAIIESGRLGQIISVEHRENIVYWHMAHSFVRGNWRRLATSSPLILAKCCHDMDLLFWNFGSAKRLSSFGSLMHFRPENAPPGAPLRCTDGCPAADACPFYAPRIYAGPDGAWPRAVIAEHDSVEARTAALRSGPYGRCVYHCDNDVVDHQTLAMEMQSGVSVSLNFVGHSHREGRTLRIDGSRATLRGKFIANEYEIQINDHLTNTSETLPIEGARSGHGGGDFGILRAFVVALRSNQRETLTSARNSLESHLMAFAAEEARVSGRVVQMDDFRQRVLY
ncbi:MAG: Gfo/Idh/MocA family oxidoreductase [Chloroflexi bacterium]|nr:Gfo/Idh/MocA family oxidoreductase [Chloroflexota bacterium]